MSALDLGYRPRAWQLACHRLVARFLVLVLHRRAGKTELAIAKLIDSALRFSLEGGLFFYVAPLLKQAKAIAWARLKSRLAPLQEAGLVEINESELLVRFLTNGAVIRVYGADNPDAMRGVRLDGVVVDEVAQIKAEVWYDILQPALADRLGWALFIGTPNGVNLFSRLYFGASALADWAAARYTVYDTDALDTAEIARLRASMPEASFAREFLCDFNAAGSDQLLSLGDIDDACRRTVQPADYTYAPLILGVDPARFGDDRSTLQLRQGRHTWPTKVWSGLDNMTLAGRVAVEIDSHRPDAVFIDGGNGAGVIDRLRQLGHDVIEINFGGKAGDARYVNKRTEMWYEMAEWVRAGGCVPDLPAMRMDLAAPTYHYDAQSRICLESKDDIKRRGLPSPDLGDALALTFAWPVAPRNRLRAADTLNYQPLEGLQAGGVRTNAYSDYHPFERAHT